MSDGCRNAFWFGHCLNLRWVLVVLVLAILLFLSSVRGEGKVRDGGAIIIGPFPIIFGTDKESIKTVLLLSLTFTILLIIVMVIFYVIFR